MRHDAPASSTSLRRRIRYATVLFLLGLLASGTTAIPIRAECELGSRVLGSDYEGRGLVPGFVASWLTTVSRGVHAQAPFLAYGTDWLAFAHFAIAIAFLGA